MRYLGIDYGSKKIGLAVSDRNGKFAFPKEVVVNQGLNRTVERTVEFIEKEDVEAIVVGHSANLRGEDNPIMKEIRQFVDELKRKKEIEIHMEPEFYTSIEAGRITGKDKNLDAQAAAIILQSFLDKE